MQRDGTADNLGQVGCNGNGLSLQPQSPHDGSREPLTAQRGQIPSGCCPELGCRRLDQHRHHVGHQDHPEQPVSVAGSSGEVGREVARGLHRRRQRRKPDRARGTRVATSRGRIVRHRHPSPRHAGEFGCACCCRWVGASAVENFRMGRAGVGRRSSAVAGAIASRIVDLRRVEARSTDDASPRPCRHGGVTTAWPAASRELAAAPGALRCEEALLLTGWAQDAGCGLDVDAAIPSATRFQGARDQRRVGVAHASRGTEP